MRLIMIRQPQGLFDLAALATCNAFDISLDVPKEFDLLPFAIQRTLRPRLKKKWMRETVLPDDPYTYEYRYHELSLLDKDEFVMITNHPRHIYPDYWPSGLYSAHIYFEHYEFRINNCDPLLLCRNCFLRCCSPLNESWLAVDYEDYWKSKNWTFYNVTRHYVTNNPRRLIKLTLRARRGWCDWCVLTPLFELYDYERCCANTHMHDMDDTDEDNDYGSESEYYDSNQIYDAYVH